MHPLIISTKPDLSKLPGGWEPKTIPVLSTEVNAIIHHNLWSSVIDGLFNQQDCDALIELMRSAPTLAPVNYQGNPKCDEENIGSVRANIWSPELAEIIWKKISSFIENINANELTLTDWWQGNRNRKNWKPIAVAPLMRFMRYEKHGKHWPHYDAGFIYSDDNFRGLMSLVIYLTSHDQGGETRMIDDKQSSSIWGRDHSDWNCEAFDSEVQFSCTPKAGRALLFLHRRCHDVAEYTGTDPRIIIRTDIIFEAIT